MARVITEHLQRGPSCDLDEHGDPKPVKYVKVTYDDTGPFVRNLDRKHRTHAKKGR
jgi:hypothetical protein